MCIRDSRKGLWRLSLPRNCAYVNSHLVACAIVLGANSDCQPILTAKGVADYVCKYITKYGAGMSVTARIASLLDDIVSRLPEDKLTTVQSLISKAFIATAVPCSLCCLEAWHILWKLPRTVCSRFFVGLNMDGLTRVKGAKQVSKESPGEDAGTPPKVTQKTSIELYRDRLTLPCNDAKLKGELPRYTLLRFVRETDMRGKNGGLRKRPKPRVVNLKPYLQLDLTQPTAVQLSLIHI